MSLESLMNHRARVWRPTQARGIRREVVNDFAIVTEPTRNNARPAPIRGTLTDKGPGEQRTLADRRGWYLTKEVVVDEKDVIEFVSGPESPLRVRVLSSSFPGRPNATGHHHMVTVEPYVGRLPSDDEA